MGLFDLRNEPKVGQKELASLMEKSLARTGCARQYSPTEQREERFLDHWTYQPVLYFAPERMHNLHGDQRASTPHWNRVPSRRDNRSALARLHPWGGDSYPYGDFGDCWVGGKPLYDMARKVATRPTFFSMENCAGECREEAR